MRYNIIEGIARGLVIKQSTLKMFTSFCGCNATVWKTGDKSHLNATNPHLVSREEVQDTSIDTDTLIAVVQQCAMQDFKDNAQRDFISDSIKMIDQFLEPEVCRTTTPIAFTNGILQRNSEDEIDQVCKELYPARLHEITPDSFISNTQLPQNTADSISLNEKQTLVKNLLLNWCSARKEHDNNPNLQNPNPLLLIIHGGPSTGKSTVINAFLDFLLGNAACCGAPTGIAAT